MHMSDLALLLALSTRFLHSADGSLEIFGRAETEFDHIDQN